MTPKEIENAIIISEFLGCKYDISWENKDSGKVEYSITGEVVNEWRDKGFITGGFGDSMMLSMTKFHSDWNWFSLIYDEICSLFKKVSICHSHVYDNKSYWSTHIHCYYTDISYIGKGDESQLEAAIETAIAVIKNIIIMDIGSGTGYPSSALSNFAGHRFILDEVEIHSLEGFLQGLKFKEAHIQVEVCKLIGKAAKFRGKPKKWYRDQTLYWKGVPYKRNSKEYQELLDRAYEACFEQSESFRNALKASGAARLTHSMGKNKITETVLTEREFCSRLMKLKLRF